MPDLPTATHVPPVAPVSLVVLTFNEARNIEACLRSATGWTQDIFVVDSGSSDDTTAIAERCGARVVSHAFETHARQWNWALSTLPITTPWVLALDADQQVTPELDAAISAALRAGQEQPAGYYLNRRQVFRGRWIRHGGYYPKHLLKLFRREHVSVDVNELVDHHFAVSGTTGVLEGDLIDQLVLAIDELCCKLREDLTNLVGLVGGDGNEGGAQLAREQRHYLVELLGDTGGLHHLLGGGDTGRVGRLRPQRRRRRKERQACCRDKGRAMKHSLVLPVPCARAGSATPSHPLQRRRAQWW